jgi:hypothetical protein
MVFVFSALLSEKRQELAVLGVFFLLGLGTPGFTVTFPVMLISNGFDDHGFFCVDAVPDYFVS